MLKKISFTEKLIRTIKRSHQISTELLSKPPYTPFVFINHQIANVKANHCILDNLIILYVNGFNRKINREY